MRKKLRRMQDRCMSGVRVQMLLGKSPVATSYEQLLSSEPPTSSAASPLISLWSAPQALFMLFSHQRWTQ